MEIEAVGEVAVLRLRGGKANALSQPLLERLIELVDEVERSGAGALVVTGVDRHFSAGLALPTLVDLDRAAMRAFMELFGTAMRHVLATPRPVIAAINGHAIAGGCVLALQCDRRIAADSDIRLGLNEVALGIGLPAVVVEPLRHALRPADAFEVAAGGELYTPARALALGLVDEIAPADELEARALARASALARVPRAAFAQVKASLRRPMIEALDRTGAGELEAWLDTWFSDVARTRIADAVARLSRPRTG